MKSITFHFSFFVFHYQLSIKSLNRKINFSFSIASDIIATKLNEKRGVTEEGWRRGRKFRFKKYSFRWNDENLLNRRNGHDIRREIKFD